MRTIPEVRREMYETAKRWREAGLPDIADYVEDWASDLHRRSPIRRAQANRWGATPSPQAIYEYAQRKPQASYMEIATEMGCSIGRVSEALTGRREVA